MSSRRAGSRGAYAPVAVADAVGNQPCTSTTTSVVPIALERDTLPSVPSGTITAFDTAICERPEALRLAIDGRGAEMYPGGVDTRTGEIEEGAGRSAADLRADARMAAHALDACSDEVAEAVWATGQGQGVFGPIAVSEIPFRRLREVEVHLVDLDLPAYGVDDWSTAYIEAELPLALDGLARRLPAGVRVTLCTPDGPVGTAGPEAATPVTVEQPLGRLVGWLLGRADIPGAPVLEPW